jgi:hypothetical protein
MQAFVVAVEYRGAHIAAPGDTSRIGVCEHAYDLQSATLAGHLSGKVLRVAFPTRQRGWNTDPELARCADCNAAVESIVRAVVLTILNRHR